MIIGGPVLNVAYLTKYMAPEYETLLIAGEKDPHEESADSFLKNLGIDYLFLPEMGRNINFQNDYKTYKKIKQIIADFKPDVVHTHAAKPGAVGRMAAHAMKVPVIVHTYHGHIFHSYFSTLKTRFYIGAERYLAKKTDAIIAISPAQKIELVNQFKIAPEEKFKVIQLGLDLNKFTQDYAEKRRRFRAEFNLAEDEIAIGIIGRIVPVKNHDLFIDAFHHVLRHSNKRVRAFIVGDGDMRSTIEQKLSNLNISFATSGDANAKVIFTSWRKDIDVINAGLDIMALSSLNEGTPVSLIEAQAAGNPIVSTTVGGITDIVEEGRTALLSDVADKENFAANLLKLVEDDQLRATFSNRGPEVVMRKFSYQRLVRDMSQLYRELLASKKNIIK
jgi:glycosyltransferase involved in cell wall biosynthesis